MMDIGSSIQPDTVTLTTDQLYASYRELALSPQDVEILGSVNFGKVDAAALKAVLKRHRSARLNTAVAQTLKTATKDTSVMTEVFGKTDWSAPARFVRTPSGSAPQPLFTILIATFNAARDLPDTLRSIQEQGRGDVECLIVDGGSSDTTLEIAAAWPQVVTACFSQADKGLYDALNKGLAVARGKLIGIVGAGDCYLPDALNTVANAFYQNGTDVYGGQTIEMTPDGQTSKRKDEPWGLNAFVSGGPVGHNGMFATRDVYDDVGPFGYAYPMAEDTRWMHRAIHARRSFTYIPRPVVLFPLTGMSNNNPDLVWQEAHGLIKQNFPGIDLNREDALKLLFAARGWSRPEEIKPVLAKYDHAPLNISAAAALKAENVPIETMVDIFDGVLWNEALPLFEKNGLRHADKAPSDKPLLSIVLPSYNVQAYLGKALNSILTQDMEDLEVIVVNDGATDNTLAVAEAFAAIDARVRILTQENQGLGQARLSGLPLCRGEYVWFIDSDDFLRDDCLSHIGATLRSERPEAYQVNFAYIDENDQVDHASVTDPRLSGMVHNPGHTLGVYTRLAGWNAQTWRFIIRRDVMLENALTFPVGYYYEDHHFALKLVSRVKTMFVDPAVSYMYLRRSGSISTVRTRRVFDFLHIRRLCLDFLREEGLLERMAPLALSYIVPTSFIRHHVAEEFVTEFVREVLKDTSAEELKVFLQTASTDDFKLVDEAVPDWIDTLSVGDNTAAWQGFIRTALTQQLAAATTQPSLHPLSRTLAPHQILGLYNVEKPQPHQNMNEHYAWNRGKDIYLRVNTANLSRPVLNIHFRNLVAGQVLVVEAPGVIQSCPAVSQNITQRQSVFVPLESCEEWVVVHIRVAHTTKFDSREGGILLESVDLLNGDIASFLPPPPASLPAEPLIKVGADSRVAGLNVDVRLHQENRTYVVVGQQCDITATFVFERGVGMISVGDGTSIGSGCLLICAQPDGIRIGRNVMLSWDVVVTDNNSHSLDRDMRENDARDWLTGTLRGRTGAFKNWQDVGAAPVTIGDGVWIGFGASIMKGVTIGEGAIIASQSVVTKDIPPYSIVGGNPARVLATRDDQAKLRDARKAARMPDLPIPEVTFENSSS
ncbi:glycosyltransferase [Rhodobacteraceae bacterium LMO-12]|nr:glycosyltransferase [Rhodobacteraceae bacterium LMO-JJ12]